jgi:hypothetical protein
MRSWEQCRSHFRYGFGSRRTLPVKALFIRACGIEGQINGVGFWHLRDTPQTEEERRTCFFSGNLRDDEIAIRRKRVLARKGYATGTRNRAINAQNRPRQQTRGMRDLFPRRIGRPSRPTRAAYQPPLTLRREPRLIAAMIFDFFATQVVAVIPQDVLFADETIFHDTRQAGHHDCGSMAIADTPRFMTAKHSALHVNRAIKRARCGLRSVWSV